MPARRLTTCPWPGAALTLLLLTGCALTGCADRRLETGYQYQPLGTSSVERRAFYADPYSLEARRAESQSDGDSLRSPTNQRLR